jgi:hypothetical protein
MKRKKRRVRKDGRVHLGFRVTPELKDLVETSAASLGRSQSQEAEFRLEWTFRAEDFALSALELAYGPQLSAMLVALGDAMKQTGGRAGFEATRDLDGAENWFNVPFAFDQSVKAAATVLNALRPEGDPSLPRRFQGGPREGIDDPASIGERIAAGILAEAASGRSDGPQREQDRAARIHRGLGKELAARLLAFNYFTTEG